VPQTPDSTSLAACPPPRTHIKPSLLPSAPGRSIRPEREVYRSAHNLLLAHAKAVDKYRRKFQGPQGGKIGITLNCDWYEPKPCEDGHGYRKNCAAAQRSLEFCMAWFADPIYKGDYPDIMRERCGRRWGGAAWRA
jgi:beta-glucosidase/6-phospho-beta-glucosidase/beta-galactosidase